MDICKHHQDCGGCIYQGVAYEEQLAEKNRQVESLLQSKDIKCGERAPIEAAPSQYGYRNKMEYTFGDLEKGGEMTLGMHRKKHFMSVVTVDECQLVDEDFNVILRAVLDFCTEKGYSKYNKKTHKGMLRHLVIRKGVRTRELLVNIVTTDDSAAHGEAPQTPEASPAAPVFDEEAFVEMLLALETENEIIGILRTINDDNADAIKCQEMRTLRGRDYYMEKIMGLDFKVSAFSFFQTNVEAAERLYREAVELIPDFSGKTVFDLYCGTGTITQSLALRAKKAVGVELVPEAVEAARENARLNGLDNCEFIAGDVFKVMEQLTEKPDVIVVDPPRVGIQPKALDKIISYGVEQIIYVSCNPKSLAENLYYLQYYGYRVDFVKPFDNFPGTKHVESVALMTRT